ncbi:MAG TPA: FecR family protein, partial [Thermodesulfovibrionales bacterium]|nr:FecR family protein [Thermodesulfovibrionales bacterium]
MKRLRQRTLNLIVVAGALLLAGVAEAADNVGSVVALKGAALIQRDAKPIEAKLKDGILLQDTVETKESSKAKLLFIDDSILTMAEKSKVIIREFIYSKDAKGRSIFNLIDGKMRSVVGRNEFEIHTPTVVAAARGTVFECEVGKSGARVFTA